jgi:hypothetical protein
MQEPLLPVGLNKTVENELSALNIAVAGHRLVMNEEGVWLFLATLGCWSVTPIWLRLLALAAVLFIFGQRIHNRSVERRSFKKLLEDCNHRITELSDTEQARKAALYSLIEFQQKNLEGLQPYKTAKNFLVSYATWVVTCVMSVTGL